MKTIHLTKGYSCVVDDSAPEECFKFRWKALVAGRHVYAVRNVYQGMRNGKKVWRAMLMHRLITKAADGFVVDHIDGNTLNNSTENLRVCTQSNNLANIRTVREKHTGTMKGCYFNKKKGKWHAQIGLGVVDGRQTVKFLGYYDTEIDAALAYDRGAVFYKGEFACTNKELFLETKSERGLNAGK